MDAQRPFLAVSLKSSLSQRLTALPGDEGDEDHQDEDEGDHEELDEDGHKEYNAVVDGADKSSWSKLLTALQGSLNQ